MNSYPNVIAGRLVNSPQQDDVINPALGKPFATCARGTSEQLNEAVTAAAEAFKTWRKDQAFRRQTLNECAAAIQEKAQDIGVVLSQEQGKPLAAAVGEVFGASIWFSYFANLRLEPEILQDDAEKRIQIVRKPLGVVAAITPWNFPVILMAWKLAPAFLAGNTVVAKPSPFTPLSSLLVGDILKDVLPPGVLSVIAGDGALGAELSGHPLVRKISFTGSVATGKKVMGYAVEDLKRVTLELGGNDPAIVLDDVDPNAVLDGLFWGAFQNSGQICSAIKRLYVHEKVYQPIVAGLIERARSVKVGNGMEPDTQLGPINNQMQLDKVIGMVNEAKKQGAKIEIGGERLDSPGYFYPPTIVTNAHAGMKLVDEEQFGTALPIIKYSNLDDAMEQANNTHYGLGASVWTGDAKRGEALVQEIESGTGWVNQHLDLGPSTPFGGCKWSGIGYENGKWGYQEFTELQVVNTKK
ncbi:MAG: aldehyde dehydrogenase family protein [Deltaproteobacteria bacterium]|nr:aldehyde dehydrogenase family protein [Deltaproteobacteria bacterium]MBI3388522.1 aldehyde dehydrogenase family protein [Deltaproteobacteria bacterium]